jgi:transporter family-2 protein
MFAMGDYSLVLNTATLSTYMTLIGACMVLQHVLNSRLSHDVGYFGAAFVFMIVGGTVLLGLILLDPLQSGLMRIGDVPLYLFIPAAVNLLRIAWLCLSIYYYGAVVTTTVSYLGQVTTAVIFDHFGFLGLPLIRIDEFRIAAVLLMTIGALFVQGLFYLGRKDYHRAPEIQQQTSTQKAGFPGGKFVSPFLLGVFISSLLTMNAALGKMIGVLETAFLFLMPGAIILYVYFQLHPRKTVPIFSKKVSPIFFIPGLINTLGVTSCAKVFPLIGVSIAVLSLFLGQCVVALLFDHFAFLKVKQSRITWTRIMGILLMVIGLWLVF